MAVAQGRVRGMASGGYRVTPNQPGQALNARMMGGRHLLSAGCVLADGWTRIGRKVPDRGAGSFRSMRRAFSVSTAPTRRMRAPRSSRDGDHVDAPADLAVELASRAIGLRLP